MQKERLENRVIMSSALTRSSTGAMRSSRVRNIVGFVCLSSILFLLYSLIDANQKWTNYQYEYERCQSRKDSLTAQIKAFYETKERLQKSLQDAKMEHMKSKSQFETFKQMQQDARQKDQLDSNVRLKGLQDQISDLEKQNEALRVENQKIDSKNSELLTDTKQIESDMRGQVNQKEIELQQIKAKMGNLQAERNDLENKLKETRQSVINSASRIQQRLGGDDGNHVTNEPEVGRVNTSLVTKHEHPLHADLTNFTKTNASNIEVNVLTDFPLHATRDTSSDAKLSSIASRLRPVSPEASLVHLNKSLILHKVTEQSIANLTNVEHLGQSVVGGTGGGGGDGNIDAGPTKKSVLNRDKFEDPYIRNVIEAQNNPRGNPPMSKNADSIIASNDTRRNPNDGGPVRGNRDYYDAGRNDVNHNIPPPRFDVEKNQILLLHQQEQNNLSGRVNYGVLGSQENANGHAQRDLHDVPHVGTHQINDNNGNVDDNAGNGTKEEDEYDKEQMRRNDNFQKWNEDNRAPDAKERRADVEENIPPNRQNVEDDDGEDAREIVQHRR